MGILDWIRDAVNSLNSSLNQNQQNNQQQTNNQQTTQNRPVIVKPSGAMNSVPTNYPSSTSQQVIVKPSGAMNTVTLNIPSPTTQPTQTTQAPQMTPYQMNLQIPTTSQPQQWNLRTLLGTAYHIGQSGQTEEASNLFNLIQQAQLDPTTPIYNPYSQATNKSVAVLQQMGIDTSNMNDNWFNSLSWLTQYYRTGAASNTPQAPTKKSSAEEIAAYHYYQVMKAEGTTRQAEQEQAALRQELFYWAANRERNYSDEQILNRIDWNKYKTLAAMRESISNGQGVAMELNRAVDCTDDWLYGELWAARNNGGTGNSYSDMIMSALGQGNSYQENKGISAKLDITNRDTYSPYSVGMTLEEEGVYFGRTYFDQAWIENNRHYLASNDETAKKMYQNVVNAELKTQELETSLTAMNKQIDELLNRNRSADDIIRAITGNSDYNNLFALNKTFDNGQLEATTRRLDYRWKDIEQQIRERCEARDKRVGAAGVADNITNIAAGAQQKQTLPGEPAEPEPEQIPTAEPIKPEVEQLPVTVPTDGSLMTPTDLGPAEEEENGQPGQPRQPAPLRSDVEEEYQRLWENRGGNKSVLTESEAAQETQFQQGASDIRPTLQDKGTSAEQTVSLTGNTNFWGALTDSLKSITGNLTKPLHALQNDILKGNYLDASRTISDYVGHREKRNDLQQNLEDTQAEWDELEELDAESVAVDGMTAEQYQVMMNLDTSDPEVQDVLTELAKGAPEGWETDTPSVEGYDYKNALGRFYQMIVGVDGISPEKETPEEVVATLEKAQLWYNYLTGDKWDKNDPASPINRYIDEADQQDEEEKDDYTSYVDDESGLEILLKKGRDGYYVFDGANDAETGEQVFTADQQREAEERMGFSSESEMPALMTDEQRARFNQLKGQRQNWEDQMRVEDDYLSINEEIYNSAVADREFMRKQYAMSAAIADALGDGTESINLSLYDYAFKLTQADYSSPWVSSLIYDAGVESKQYSREQATQMAGDTAQANMLEAKQLRSLVTQMEMAGVPFTEEEKAALERNIGQLEWDAENAAYCTLDGAPDFAEVAAAGREKAGSGYTMDIPWSIAHGEFPLDSGIDIFRTSKWFDSGHRQWDAATVNDAIKAMTEEEKNRFFYLYEKEGEDAARKYWDVLTSEQKNGMLNVRRSQQMQNELYKYGKNNGFVATVLSFATNVIGGAKSTIYALEQKLRGEEVNPYSAAYNESIATGSMRTGSRESWENLFGGADSVGGKISGLLYDAFTSAVDSRINAAMVGATFNAVGQAFEGSKFFKKVGELAEKAKNSDKFGGLAKFGLKAGSDFAHAASMGLNAASSAYREALLATGGKDEEKALKMAMATFFAETASEAITVGNIHEAFAAGEDEARRSLGNFVKELFKNGAEEFLGEGANEWIEANADRVIMGELSDYEQNVQEYMDSGLPETVARQMADQQMWKNILVAGATGFISSGFGTTAEYARGALRGNQTGGTVTIEEPGQQQGQQQATQEQAVQPGQEQTAQQGQEQTEQTEQPAEATPAAESGNAAAGALAEMNANPAQALTGMTEDRQALLRGMQKDMLLLSSANEADSTGAAVAIASVLNTGDDFADRTVAQEMVANIAENDPKMAARIMQGILNHTMEVEHPETLKADVAMATLTRGKANTALEVIHSKIMNNMEVVAADVQELQRALADDMATDPNGMTDAYNRAVRENWIANRTQEIMVENGGAEQIRAAQDKVDDAQRGLAQAQDGLEEAQGTLEATAGNLQGVEANYNPAEVETAAPLQQTTNQLLGADAVVSEFEQSVENANEAVTTAKENFDKTQDDALTAARQQATEEADQMFAEMAEQKQKEAEAKAEQEKKAQEEAKAAEANANRQSGRTLEERIRAVAETNADMAGLEGTEREQFIERVMNRGEKINLRKVDMNGKLSTAEGMLALHSFERKLGLKIEFSDDLGSARGKYSKGVVYLNNKLMQDGNMTTGQALVETALHEITHAFENTNSYNNYAHAVMGMLYGDSDATIENNSQLRADIDSKIATYKDKMGVDLTPEDAQREIIADFARTRLNDSEVIERFLDLGMAGKMRNTLHNINQAMKNFFGKLTGEDRTTAEYLRKAERAYQKALNELAKTKIHPENDQFSISQFAQATGMRFDEKEHTLFDKDGKEIDGVKNKVTTEMIANTPVGRLIDAGLTGKQNTDAKEMMAGLMNMVARYKDSNLVWEIGASTLSSTFSALKGNADPQYKNTVDFGTICTKTQAIVNVMSKVMMNKIDPNTHMLKEGAKRGLTRDEIMTVYDEVHKAGLSVPCPVCYVFSRWMGVPSLLGQMSQYQHDFVVMNEDGKTINDAETQKRVDAYIQTAESRYGNAKGINNAKTKLQAERTKLETKREQLMKQLNDKTLSKEAKNKIRNDIKDITAQQTKVDKQIGEVSAYNWITQALCKKDSHGKFVVDDNFKVTPDDILFDLNRTGEFAKYKKNWAYRTTRGSGMGKAIMPYSGESIGDILYGVKKNGRINEGKNPWLHWDEKAAKRQLKGAQERARVQNLLGGQRLQSTSDFRPEWGLDYIMSFLELQAAKSKVQMYTKVAEAVDFFASVGADINLSIMAKDNGFHEASAEEIANMTEEQRKAATVDGKIYVMDFSDITGMKYKNAKDLKDKYDNVQMILVGMNDTHIRLAMANSDIDFIIPWHSSGNSKDVLSKLISSVGEKLNSSSDYTSSQSDSFAENRTEEQKTLWNARMKILMGEGNQLTQEERRAAYANPYLADLYNRFYVDESSDCYHVVLKSDQAKQIFPYEYWDTSSIKDNADINGKRFVEYCEAMGIVPRFSQFKDDTGYWKLLIDRPMYNRDGSYHQQQTIDVTKARIGSLDESGTLVDSDLPTQAQAKYAPNDKRSEHYQEYTEAERRAVENAMAMMGEQYDDGTEGQYSVMGDVTDADIDQMLYSVDGEATDADIDQMIASSGVYDDASNLPDGYEPGIQEEETLPGTDTSIGPQRQFGRYRAQESDALHQETKDWLYNHSTYTPDSNGAQINRAVGWVQQHSTENDPTGYHAAVAEALSDDFNSMSADGQARMLTLMSMAAIQNDTATERLLADAFNRQGTKAGQTLQARKIFRLMTPLGRQSILQGQVDQINNDLRNQGKEGNVELSYWIMEAAKAAQTEAEFDRVRDAANKDIAGQLPVTWKDRLQTWRMTSMLANPRTHVRNFIGNGFFVPVVQIKNAIGAGLESAFIKEGERTKSIVHSQEAKAFAKQDSETMKDTLTGEAKYSPEDKVQREKKAFGTGNGLLSRTLGRAVQGLADFNSNALEREDWVFLNRHYQNALASYMTANNLTAADMTGDTLDKARTYAVLEAQKATYRDANAVSDWLNKMSSRGGVGGFLVDAILPFKKTPANILRRGVEYSPVGLIKSIATAKQSLDKYAAWEANGMKGDMPKGAKNANQVIDEIAAGLTGTGIAAIGALLYSMGAVKIGLDDDDSELEKLQGSQEYSLELFGHSITLDWAAPACMPFFTGASLYKTLSEQINNGGGVDIGAFVDSMSGIAEPVFNLSMLDGVNSLLQSASYASNNGKVPVWQLLEKVGANYLSSYVPSAMGAAARTIDTTRRKSYVESGASMSIWRSMLEQVENKIPYLSMRNIPYRNVWGEAETSSRGEALLENFILPGYHTEMKEDKLVSELQRIFDRTGDNAVIPKAASKTVGGEKLNDQQYDEYTVTRGQLAKSLLTELVERPEFVALTENNPEAQVQLIKNVYEYCNAAARYETLHTGTMDGWIAKAYASGNVIDTLFEREEEKAKDAYTKQAKQDLFSSIDNQNAEAISTSVEALRQAGQDNKSIRTFVMNNYRDQYKQAYLANDRDTMDAIESGMLYLDLGDQGFTDPDLDKNSIFNKWKKDADSGKDTNEGTSGSTDFYYDPSRFVASAIGAPSRGRNIPETDTATGDFEDTIGQFGKGNIDLNNRQVVRNDDGTISTEVSMSFYDEDTGKEVLIPTVINGQIVSDDEAIEHYYRTGEYLGMFDTWQEADAYADLLHRRQEWYYNR
jgi:hypothetical protein